MPRVPSDNDLYLAVLPLVHYSRHFAGESFEEVMTLVPDRNFATEFSPDVVDLYILTFRSAAAPKYGGPGRLFNFYKQNTEDGKVLVVVTPA